MSAVLCNHQLIFVRQVTVAEAMRDLLESFRLPGESQQIARITETFAEIYFATEPGELCLPA